VVLTWFFACGAMDYTQFAEVTYPLAKVVGEIPIGKSPIAVYGFGLIALFGMIASYHGMIYGTSRQLFGLGRAGYLPPFLGEIHTTRRTPVASLAVSSLITAGFCVANLWFKAAVDVAVLVSTLTALIWYILAMGCLYILRLRESGLFKDYRAPLYHVLPVTVVLLSVFAVYVYAGIDVKVIPLTALLYGLGLCYYWFWAHRRIKSAAPEESAAQQASERGVDPP